MSEVKKKKLISLFSIVFTVMFLVLTVSAILYSMQKVYTHQIKSGEMIKYEILIVILSLFAGIAVTYFFSKIKGKSDRWKDTSSRTLIDSDSIRKQFLSIQDFYNLSYVEIDVESNVIFANKNADILFSTKSPKLIGSHIRSLIPQEYLSDDDITNIFSGEKEIVNFTLRLDHGDKDGPIILQGLAEPVIDLKGIITKVQILLRDLTDIVKLDERINELENEISKIKTDNDVKLEDSLKANEKLRKSIRILSDTFISAPTGLIILDKKGNITNCNRAAENLFDYHETDVKGKSIDKLYTKHNFKNDFLSKAKTGKSVEGEIDCLRSDLSHFVGMVKVKPVLDDKHDIAKYVLSINDVTKKAKLEKFILLKNQELLSINDIFMSTNQYNSLNKKLNVFLDKIFDNFEIIRKALVYLKTEKNSLELYLYKGFNYAMLKDIRSLDVKDSLCGHSLQTEEVIISKTVTPKEIGNRKDELKENDVSSNHIYLPIAYKERLLGVLIIFPNKNYHYNSDDLSFFKMISSELAICIKQALKYEELKKRFNELQLIEKGKKKKRVSSAK
jgi:PAS domain S-box-containing protein